MSEIKDGGLAFPYEHKEWDTDNYEWRTHFIHQGMSLRDYFAAKALVGICAMVAAGKHESRDFTGRPLEEKLALDAFRLAEAMLKARQA